MSDRSRDGNSNEITDYLRKLCTKICSENKDMTKVAYRMAVSSMADSVCSSRGHVMEDVICTRIQEHILHTRSTHDVDKFNEHYQQLKTSLVLKNRPAILELMHALSPSEHRDLGVHERNQLSKARHLASLSLPIPDENNLKYTKSAPVINSINPIFGIKHTNSENQILRESQFANIDRRNKNKIPDDCLISEREMVQEVLYAAQGVKISENANRNFRGRAGLMSRIAELGFLHDKICYYMDPSSGCMPIGLVGEGLVSAFRDELTEYYRSLAILQSQFNSSSPDQVGNLTLRRLLVWSLEPLQRLKWLATIGHASQNKKGGELASCVHQFLAHGDPRVTSLVHQLLVSVCHPMYIMLCRWLLDGEIDDPHNEFFIDGRDSVSTERLWHDKYRVRETMLPAFISKKQAQDILATGKSVTFLREVCGDRGQLSERETLKRVLENSSVELLFSGGTETKLHGVMSSAYLGVSRRLLDTLLGPHKLLQHLQALRGYLLLGQGDFIQMLMVLLEPELNKNANQLYVHNLTCILESAIRATNAQYEDSDILNRLYVNLFPPSAQDNGWDVFSLFYRVEGPLGTVLEPKAAASYRTLFTHLWRAKRMEYTLAQMWKQHTIEYKTFSKMREVMPLLRRLHALRSEMVHLVKELQYALFVVIECAWQRLSTGARKSHALDQLLSAHRQFLSAVTAGALLDEDETTKQLQSYLGNVYDEILSLRHFETDLYKKISEESDRRKNIEKLKEERGLSGKYGITAEEEEKNEKQKKIFLQYLNEKKADFNILSRAYRGHVKTFLLKLALQNESSLQFLLFRLDYNDFYKRGDSKLHEPLTYQHKRLSEIGLSHAQKQNGISRNKDQITIEKFKDRNQDKIKKFK